MGTISSIPSAVVRQLASVKHAFSTASPHIKIVVIVMASLVVTGAGLGLKLTEHQHPGKTPPVHGSAISPSITSGSGRTKPDSTTNKGTTNTTALATNKGIPTTPHGATGATPNNRSTSKNQGSPSNSSNANSGRSSGGGSSGGSSSSCSGTANTPGGADPWGGCFPGTGNSGVPSGVDLVSVDSGNVNPPNNTLPSDNAGWKFSTSAGYIVVSTPNAVIDGISDSDGIYLPSGDSLTVEDSQTGLINDEGSSLTIVNSTLNGGSQETYPTIDAPSGNIEVKYANVSGGKDEVNCNSNCTVENSWLHDNYVNPSGTAHQQSFIANGGSTFTLSHNSFYCTGNCTSDISFLSTDDNATISNNLLVAAPNAAYCVYPGPDASTQTSINDMIWENNVFQKGAIGKCATYGPVYGWYPTDGTGNVWSGNVWDDGTTLSE